MCEPDSRRPNRTAVVSWSAIPIPASHSAGHSSKGRARCAAGARRCAATPDVPCTLNPCNPTVTSLPRGDASTHAVMHTLHAYGWSMGVLLRHNTWSQATPPRAAPPAGAPTRSLVPRTPTRDARRARKPAREKDREGGGRGTHAITSRYMALGLVPILASCGGQRHATASSGVRWRRCTTCFSSGFSLALASARRPPGRVPDQTV